VVTVVLVVVVVCECVGGGVMADSWALHWCRVETGVFGASGKDAESRQMCFRELMCSSVCVL